MDAFTIHQGVVAPLDQANVDTDAIIPARFLKVVSRSGFGKSLFRDWRYLDGGDVPDPAFVLNQPRYQQATILLARANFGCGSSREHAPWALYEYGFRVVIAPSFGDIFYNNCLNVGLLPVRLSAEQVQSLFDEIAAREGYSLAVDLPEQRVVTPAGQHWHFEIDAFRKDALVQGADAIGRTLQFQDEIAAYEARRSAWLVPAVNPSAAR
ncbi:MAG: 3-isopropylmalate dehydratase small subunit [Ktedonobacteraceae bacterium]|nr:3-isopropylmalate dehydratase small subunit [Ktedonobacteraceae bacterium]MBO0791356.1 3-isopropylmalate dehydratase small subunit [Ktedonobacteraceae bacterium]